MKTLDFCLWMDCKLSLLASLSSSGKPIVQYLLGGDQCEYDWQRLIRHLGSPFWRGNRGFALPPGEGGEEEGRGDQFDPRNDPRRADPLRNHCYISVNTSSSWLAKKLSINQ